MRGSNFNKEALWQDESEKLLVGWGKGGRGGVERGENAHKDCGL